MTTNHSNVGCWRRESPSSTTRCNPNTCCERREIPSAPEMIFIKYDALHIECIHFEEIFLKTLNVHAPLKKRFLRANNSPFMNKQLCKAIMARSRLRNKYLKLKTNDSKNAYKKQRNYCVGLLKKVKKQFYVNFVYDNKRFWKQIKPFFSDKSQSCNNITLVENNEIISDPILQNVLK